MADDRMRNDDDLQRNMGTGREDQGYGGGQGQQTPGRNPQGGQQGGGQQGGQRNKPLEDDEDEFGGGTKGQGGGQKGGGQQGGGQNR